MRRRLDLNRLSDQILVALHQTFFDDTIEYVPFKEIREAIQDQPANALKLELANLIQTNHVVQQTEERQRSSGFLVGLGQPPAIYRASIDGYKISKTGILFVEDFDDNYYQGLQRGSEQVAKIEGAIEAERDDWEPIPLDRTDELQKEATEALDRIIEQLRGDNGYAATNPEEKTFVQDKLSAVIKRLKENSQISWMYLLEFAFKPLGIVIRRYGGAAVGVAAMTAKDALTSWLKSRGISFLDDLVK